MTLKSKLIPLYKGTKLHYRQQFVSTSNFCIEFPQFSTPRPEILTSCIRHEHRRLHAGEATRSRPGPEPRATAGEASEA